MAILDSKCINDSMNTISCLIRKKVKFLMGKNRFFHDFVERFYAVFRGIKIHPIFFERQNWIRKKYFIVSSKITSLQMKNIVRNAKNNISSLDFNRGITFARYNGHGYFFQVDPGNTIESYIMIEGAWEPYLLNVIEQALSLRDGIFIDIGANVGATAVPLASSNRRQQIVCFEPHPINARRLRENRDMNKLGNISVEEKAVSDIAGKIFFYAQRGSRNMGLSSLQLNHDIDNYEKIEVETVTVDDFFRERLIPCSAIKIDVQGFEWQVLKGAKKIIQEDRPYIFFEHEDEYFSSQEKGEEIKNELTRFFKGMNYVLCSLPHPETGFMPTIVFEGYFHGDIIAIPLEDYQS